MPLSLIETPLGVNHLAVVILIMEPSGKSLTIWTDPLPKVVLPIVFACP